MNLFFACLVALSAFAVVLPYAVMLASSGGAPAGIPAEDAPVMDDGDPYHHAWHFWWVSSAVGSGRDPRSCPLVYVPAGASLTRDHVGWFDTLLFALAGTGRDRPGLSLNLSLLLGTVLAGVFGWLLAREWGAGRYGALLTALAIAWLPARTAHVLQHYQVANCWALPASLWLCRRYLKRGGRASLALLAAASLAGGMESPFILIFILAGIPATVFAASGSWKRGGRLAAAWAVPAALLAFLYLSSHGEEGVLAPHWREAVYWSAEPQSFILPSPFGLFAAASGMPGRFSWMPNVHEGVVTPGLTVLVAFLLLSAGRRHWKLALTVAGFWVLALGPELKLLGRPLGVPLPFRLLQLLPILDGIRAPARFAIPGGMLAAVGAGLALSRARAGWKAVFLALMALEMGVLAIPALSPAIPSVCRELPAGSTVIEIPVDPTVRRYSWFQTGGAFSRRYSFLARLPDLEDEQTLIGEALLDRHVVLYHRWLHTDDERARLDSVYAPFFPSSQPNDSVWIRI